MAETDARAGSQAARTLRHTASPWTLVRTALGGPREVAGKLQRMARTARLWVDGAEVDRRLRTLEARGYIERRPTRLQIAFGSYDMLRFVITPAARDYYARQGVGFGLHQLLRILDDPVSMIDPTGFLSDRDTIIGHVMQVVHLNPVYDLQLLQMFDDGLAEMEDQAARMVEGTHPRARTIGAIVEDPDYHARLLAYVRRYRRDRQTEPIVRDAGRLREDPTFAAAERTFATLPGFIAYCNGLPRGTAALWRRARSLEAFPVAEAREPVYG